MALQVWLPMNDPNNIFKDRGLRPNEIMMVDDYVSVSKNGKIGSCLSFDGEEGCIYADNSPLNNDTEEFSFCCWIKKKNEAGGCLFTNRTTVTDKAISIFLQPTILFDDGTRWSFTPSINIAVNQWVHICFTRKKGVGKKFYVNGVLSDSTTITGTPLYANSDYYMIGAKQQSETVCGGDNLYADLNDVRIYDHCLSVKEIKEISKAIVCHWPLNYNGVRTPLNMVDDSANFKSWTVDNSGDRQWTLGISDDGTKMYSFSRTGATSNRWHRIIPTLRVDGNDYPEGITVSMDILTPNKSVINQTCFMSLQQYNSAGSRTGWYEPWVNTASIVNGKWSRISMFFSQAALLTNSQGLVYAYTKFSFQLVQNGEVSYRHIKIERGNTATDWCPSLNDINSDNIEYDISGLGNHGTRISTDISSNYIKYLSSTKFNGTDSRITCGRGGMVTDAITVNTWAYMEDWKSYGTVGMRIISCTEAGGWNFEPNGDAGNIGFALYTVSGGYATSVWTSDGTLNKLSPGWHMFTGTYDGLTTKFYIDAEIKVEKTSYTTKSLIGYNSGNQIIIGTEAGSSATAGYGWFLGDISDVRIYATALSKDDLLELYKNSCSVSNNGIIFTNEFIEETG